MAVHAEDIILVACYGIIFLCGTIGNTLVIKFLSTKAQWNKAANKLLTVLAINDFLSSICVPLLQIQYVVSVSLNPVGKWYLGKGLCYTLPGLQVTFLVATSWLLILVSIEWFR